MAAKPIFVAALNRAEHLRQRTQEFAKAWRAPIIVVALAAFAAGTFWSFTRLDISPAALKLGPLLILLFVAVPATIAYSALNMMLMARATQVPMSFAQGVKVSVYAQVAEMLPIPGGAIVRTAALVRAGGTAARSTELVIAFSLLWIACGGVGAGLALANAGWFAQFFAAASAAATLAIACWLAWRQGVAIALLGTALRILGVALMAWRLTVAFAIVGVAISAVDAAAFGYAAILGSAASIVPSGLGVSEGLSAMVAAPSGVAPAAAFLAAALSRLVGFALNMTLGLAYSYANLGRRSEPAHG